MRHGTNSCCSAQIRKNGSLFALGNTIRPGDRRRDKLRRTCDSAAIGLRLKLFGKACRNQSKP